MLFCFTSISAEILLHVLGDNFGTERHILAYFCSILLPLKAWEIICVKAVLLWSKNVLMKWTPGACIIKLLTAVIYGFRHKLECLSLNTRLNWKGLPGTNTLAYNRNHKITPVICFMIQAPGWQNGICAVFSKEVWKK